MQTCDSPSNRPASFVELLTGHFALTSLIPVRHVDCSTENRHFAAPGGRFSGMVSTGHPRSRIGRTLGRTRVHGNSPLGLWVVGKYAAPSGCDVPGDRSSQCLLPIIHSAQLF